MSKVVRFLLALLVLNGVIIIHELGHFFAGRMIGVEMDSISLGFGPALLSYDIAPNLALTLSAVPLGGYVLIGDRGKDQIHRKNVFQKVFFYAAGIIVNWALPIPILLILSPWYRGGGLYRSYYPETLMRGDLLQSRRFKFPLIGPIFFFKALIHPLGDNVAEEFAWKFNDLSRIVGFTNLYPLFILDGAGIIKAMSETAVPEYFKATTIVLTIISFYGIASIKERWSPVYRKLL